MAKGFNDDPQMQNYAKTQAAADPGLANSKQIAHENLPHRMAKSQTVAGGNVINRAMGQYAKNAPEPNGMGMIGSSILSMSRNL